MRMMGRGRRWRVRKERNEVPGKSYRESCDSFEAATISPSNAISSCAPGVFVRMTSRCNAPAWHATATARITCMPVACDGKPSTSFYQLWVVVMELEDPDRSYTDSGSFPQTDNLNDEGPNFSLIAHRYWPFQCLASQLFRYHGCTGQWILYLVLFTSSAVYCTFAGGAIHKQKHSRSPVINS